jgi:hypothetical protein
MKNAMDKFYASYNCNHPASPCGDGEHTGLTKGELVQAILMAGLLSGDAAWAETRNTNYLVDRSQELANCILDRDDDGEYEEEGEG